METSDHRISDFELMFGHRMVDVKNGRLDSVVYLDLSSSSESESWCRPMVELCVTYRSDELNSEVCIHNKTELTLRRRESDDSC